MRIPEGLAPLFDYGIIEEVVRPLMSGKEAQVFLVLSRGKQCVAKVYKEAQNRTFKNRAEYTEGRKVRNSRDQRAIGKRTKHGRAQDEAAWRSTEVDMIHRLHAGGVRVPTPYHFIDGVLIMELIADAEGNPAPRLGDVAFEPHEAQAIYEQLIREVVRMLCAGVVHGDLSDFNILLGADGPVLIDFPQSVDTAHNTNARKLLLRDVDNMHRFLSKFVPHARRMPYAEEMWDLHQQNLLTPETRLGGRFRAPERRVDTASVLDLIGDANRDERKRRDALGLRGGPRIDGGDRPEPSRDAPARPHPAAPRGPDAPRAPSGQHRPPPRQITQQQPRQGAPQQHARESAPREGAQPYPREGAQRHEHPRPNAQQHPRQSAQQHPRQGAQQHPRQGAPQHPRKAAPQNEPPHLRREQGARPGDAPPERAASRTEHVAGPRNRRPGGAEGPPAEGRRVEVIVVRNPPRRPR